MTNNLIQWIALTATIIGGTVYIDDIKAAGIATQATMDAHFKQHAQAEKYDEEFRAEVRQSHRDIKAQIAKD